MEAAGTSPKTGFPGMTGLPGMIGSLGMEMWDSAVPMPEGSGNEGIAIYAYSKISVLPPIGLQPTEPILTGIGTASKGTSADLLLFQVLRLAWGWQAISFRAFGGQLPIGRCLSFELRFK